MARPWTINKSRRLEAANACDQMACSNDAFGIGPSSDIQNNVVGKPPVLVLASAAFGAIYQFIDKYDTVREVWSEAAQLLRDGWSPGDSIVTMSERLEREAEKIIEAKHKELDAAGVPADAETLVFEETERVIDDGPIVDAANYALELYCDPTAESPEVVSGLGDWTPEAIEEANEKVREIQNEPADDGSELINY